MARSEHVKQNALAAGKNWQLSNMGLMPRLLSLNVMPCHAMPGAFRVTSRMAGCSRKSHGLFQAFRSYGRRKQM